MATVDGDDGWSAGGDAGRGAGQRRAGDAGVGRYAPDAAADDAAYDGDDAGMHPGMQGSPGEDTVYRLSLNFLTASSHTSTQVEMQFTGDDLLSLHEMRIDLGEPDTPVPAGRAAPKKKKTKGRARWSASHRSPLFTTPPRGGSGRRMSMPAWPRRGCRFANMWAKIRAAYRRNCPHAKDYSGEECRKGWECIRAAVG